MKENSLIILFDTIRTKVERVHGLLKGKKLTIGTAESCTGGLIGACLTHPPGASETFLGSVVSYSNQVKMEVLGVSEEILKMRGAVSRDCAEAMATGALKALKVDCAVSVTGVAGPGGGTDAKPIGLVWMAVASTTASGVAVVRKSQQIIWPGEREEVRSMTTLAALSMLENVLQGLQSRD